MNEKDIKLFSEFPPVSTEAWEAQINTDLKGMDYDKTLIWHTNEGINVRPYYRSENLHGLEFVGTLPGQVPAAAKTTFTNAINTAITARDKATTNEGQVKAAIYNLGVAETNFKAAIIK